jgi:hypothetical protein
LENISEEKELIFASLSRNTKYLKSAHLKRANANPRVVCEQIQNQHQKTYLAQLKKKNLERQGKDDEAFLDAYLRKVALFPR